MIHPIEVDKLEMIIASAEAERAKAGDGAANTVTRIELPLSMAKGLVHYARLGLEYEPIKAMADAMMPNLTEKPEGIKSLMDRLAAVREKK